MKLTLYIKDKHIHSLPIDIAYCDLLEQREKMVNECGVWLKRKYRRDLSLTNDWEIVLTVKSKMNEKVI